MPKKEQYRKEKMIRDLYRKESLGNQSFSEFRKALKKVKKDNLIQLYRKIGLLKGRIVWVVSIPVELDESLRNIISLRNKANHSQAFKRGDLRDAVEEALRDWLAKQTMVINKREY